MLSKRIVESNVAWKQLAKVAYRDKLANKASAVTKQRLESVCFKKASWYG